MHGLGSYPSSTQSYLPSPLCLTCRQLGSGKQGSVVVAKDLAAEKLVAIKQVRLPNLKPNRRLIICRLKICKLPDLINQNLNGRIMIHVCFSGEECIWPAGCEWPPHPSRAYASEADECVR